MSATYPPHSRYAGLSSRRKQPATSARGDGSAARARAADEAAGGVEAWGELNEAAQMARDEAAQTPTQGPAQAMPPARA